MVRAAGFEPAISCFQDKRGRPDSPTPCLGRGSAEIWLVVRIAVKYIGRSDLSRTYAGVFVVGEFVSRTKSLRAHNNLRIIHPSRATSCNRRAQAAAQSET